MVEGKLLRVWGKSGGIILEKEHGESACQKCNADEGGGDWGGGGDQLLMWFIYPGY